MNPETVRVDEEKSEDRYSRLRLIPWWDQAKIESARVLVVGAGALGNEILKNLALMGFFHIVVVDMDRIELSNLSRAILFRSSDVGNYKAEAVAAAYTDLLPEARVQPLVANIMQDCGLGLFAWADLILAGLDNREARLWINRSAWKAGRPWIDGAIEGLNGVARVFLPGKHLATSALWERRIGQFWGEECRATCCSTNLTSRDGFPPRPPSRRSSPAFRCRRPSSCFTDFPHWPVKVTYSKASTIHRMWWTTPRIPECLSHYTLDRIVQLPSRSSEWTLEQLLQQARSDLKTTEAVVEFSRDIIHKLTCPGCGMEEEVFAPVGSVSYERGRCPHDAQMRVVQTLAGYKGESELAARRLDQLGLPLFDIFTARSIESEISYCLAGDATVVLGALSAPGVPA